MQRAPWIALLLGGCNQLLGIPEPERAPDAGAGLRCDPAADFTSFEPVAGLNTADLHEQNLWLDRDERMVVFSRDLPGRHGDLFIARRPDRTAAFSEPIPLTELSTTEDEYRASLSDDALTIYFDRQLNDPGASPRYQIFTASRPTAEGAFAAPVLLPVINAAGQNFAPFVTADGLFFASTRLDGLASLYYARREHDRFATPVPVVGPGTGAGEEDPVLGSDGLQIYFSSQRSGNEPKADVWASSRPAPDRPFGAAHRVDSVNAAGLDSPQWISDDDCRLYLSTDRAGTRDFWVAERSPR